MLTQNTNRPDSGFTLIELAIVLVIIGLIIGGVLVGQDLIKAAEVRSTIAQKEKYDAAVNTFRLKYNGIPGDLANPTNYFASVVALGTNGHADGDGLIEGASAAATPCTAGACTGGESSVAWYELHQAGLISEGITNATMASYTLTPGDANMPTAKLTPNRWSFSAINGVNYYVLGNPGTAAATAGLPAWAVGLTTLAAFQIDQKVDDGRPATGQVLSVATATALPGTAANGAATASVTSATCYDSTTGVYATAGTNTGTTPSCILSLRSSF